ASIWLRPGGTNLWDAFLGTECIVQLLSELNGEAICFDGDGLGYYTTSEGLYQPIHYFASVNAALAVTEIMSSSSHVGTNGDWWELTYAGTSTVDLAGYSWDDNNQRVGQNVFGNATIGPGESIIVIDAAGAGVSAWKSDWDLGAEVGVYGVDYFSGSFSGLGSADGIFLYDPSGDLVTSVTYPSRTAGVSNEWDTDGTFLGLSVIGENGAYQSLNSSPDVGSPGYAVIPSSTVGTIYVDVNAPGPTHDGSSWHDAYLYLRDALADANSKPKPVEIWVAGGTYTPDCNSAEPNGTGDRKAIFQLINGVKVSGGYAGYGAPDPNERNIGLYETILSGDLDGDDGPNFTNNADNSYHVVTGSATDDTAVLDGFTITGGNADGPAPSDKGGGMYNDQGSPTVTSCEFSLNSARICGAGMYNYFSGVIIISDCTFSDNSAGYEGGAIFNWISDPILTNSVFSGNTAGGDGGGMFTNHGFATLGNCTFSENTADRYGGGIYNAKLYDDVVLTNCIFWGNVAEEGPQIGLGEPVMGGAETFVSYCDIQGGQLDVYDPGEMLRWGDGNIDADPSFADEASGDYHLLPCSPAIDAGDPTSDYTDEPWPNGSIINMGAYGNTCEATGSSADFEDLAVFASYWLTDEPLVDIAPQPQGDGISNFFDFATFAEYWLCEQ
ncbi:MAG: lamin tail domain-containing protein, partial [Planctomycetota bacterium]